MFQIELLSGGVFWVYAVYPLSKEKMEAITELAAIKNRKKVRCDDTGEIYSSIRAASVATGISRANISNCAHGRYKQACGQHWSFV